MEEEEDDDEAAAAAASKVQQPQQPPPHGRLVDSWARGEQLPACCLPASAGAAASSGESGRAENSKGRGAKRGARHPPPVQKTEGTLKGTPPLALKGTRALKRGPWRAAPAPGERPCPALHSPPVDCAASKTGHESPPKRPPAARGGGAPPAHLGHGATTAPPIPATDAAGATGAAGASSLHEEFGGSGAPRKFTSDDEDDEHEWLLHWWTTEDTPDDNDLAGRPARLHVALPAGHMGAKGLDPPTSGRDAAPSSAETAIGLATGLAPAGMAPAGMAPTGMAPAGMAPTVDLARSVESLRAQLIDLAQERDEAAELVEEMALERQKIVLAARVQELQADLVAGGLPVAT